MFFSFLPFHTNTMSSECPSTSSPPPQQLLTLGTSIVTAFTGGSPSVRIFYFASVRTTIGQSGETIALPTTPFPLSSLVTLIGDKYAKQGVGAVLKTCRWSVDNTLIEIDEIGEWSLNGGEEVAAIPPVSGG